MINGHPLHTALKGQQAVIIRVAYWPYRDKVRLQHPSETVATRALNLLAPCS